ncbi:MAG TPA: DNA polymerase III subunit alpha [archaeon]|nr:DNA polymerase III subunit alpha [archaeon]
MEFVHLRCHSNFSLLEGASTVAELVETAAGRGMSALALTDTNGLYAAVPFWKKARERGIKPVFGAELTSSLERAQKGGRAVVLARDREGFAAVCRLVTARQLEEHFDLAGAIVAEVSRRGDSLFVLTGEESLLRGLAGRLPEGTLYAELCLEGGSREGMRLERLAELARELGLPVAATANVHFAQPEDFQVHRLLRAIDLGRTVSSLGDNEHVPAACWLAGADEMARRFERFPDSIANTVRIAGRCNVELPTGGIVFPAFKLPKGESAYSALLKSSFRGACRRYRPLSAKVLERLKAELEVIDRLGFAPYFLVVADIARYARKKRIPMVGRGSAANSIVSYALGITDVDPIRYNLFFERFLNPERDSPPDIDLDFSWRRRDEVLDYVYRTYGADRVAMICTYVTFSTRLAFREIAKAMGLPEKEITRFTRLLPYRALSHLDSLQNDWPECRTLPLDKEPYRTILENAVRIKSFPRHLSIHAGGIVVSPFPLTDLVPLERSTKGLVVTQYDMFGIEDLGLVKIDLLSQRSLSVVEDVVRTLEERGLPKLALDDIDSLSRDPDTVRIIEEGRTMGCFYIESPAMRSLLAKLRVRTFEELTAASSVIRPGVAESGMMAEFIERHNGRRPVTYLHPSLENLLGETYGVMVYQEDVIRVAHEIAGMSLGEADLLRRAMSGKMRSREAMTRLEENFVRAAVSRGVKREVALEIWRQISSFAGYAFCKAHSASYARVSFQVACLKAHYPGEFMAAVLSNGGGFYGPSAYLEEARRMGLRILPPDVNRSSLEYEGCGRILQVGLGAVSGVSRKTLEAIVRERRAGGFFTSLADFCSRVNVSYMEMQTLIRCGVFDCLELTRPELLWRLEFLFRRGQGNNGKYRSGEPSMLFPDTKLNPDRQVIPRLPEYSRSELLRLEHEIFGFTVSEHPLALHGQALTGRGLISSREIPAHEGRRVRLAGRPIAHKRIMTPRNGAMMFLSLDDLVGTFEVVIFPGCYRRFGAVALGSGPFLVTGRVAGEYGVFTIVCEKIEELRLTAQPFTEGENTRQRTALETPQRLAACFVRIAPEEANAQNKAWNYRVWEGRPGGKP